MDEVLHMRISADLKAAIVRACGNETAAKGERVTLAEWVRDALEQKLTNDAAR